MKMEMLLWWMCLQRHYSKRSAIAYGEIYVGKEILEKIVNHQMKKVMFFQWQKLLELWQ